ncbi:MAG: alpha-amylase family glycosyl hydrolase [Bacilli bacterium]
MELRSILRTIGLSILTFSLLVPLSACNGKKDDDEETTITDAAYEEWVSSWSESGHLYLHYNRGEEASISDYESYCLWLWPHRPNDLEGTLWAYKGVTEVSSSLTLHPMSTRWMNGVNVSKGGNTTWKDKYGAIVDVDLYNSNLKTGKNNNPVSFANVTNVGFLLVSLDSMDGSSNWISDGGKETYVTDFDTHFREDGSMHIYVNTGNFDKYAFTATGTSEPEINPVVEDTSGVYRSDIDTITDSYGVSSTSDSFTSLGVGYQIFVASFRDSDGDGIGDLRGIIDSLGYLNDLGIQVLWLTPIQQSDSYHGYDISDFYAIDSKFGTLEDYRELLYKAHEKDIKIVMDLVLNHTSKSNVWFKNSQWAKQGLDEEGKVIDWRNVYHWKYATDTVKKYDNGQYVTISVQDDAKSNNPSWYRDGESNYYYYGKFGSGMPEINYECQATRDLVKNMAKYWLSFGLDGFRLDAVKHIYMKDEVDNTGSDIIIPDVGSKTSYDDEKGALVTRSFDYSSDLTKNLIWWKEFANELKAIFPECFLVGENFDGWGTRIAPYYQALDSQFDFSAYYHISQFLYANPSNSSGSGASQYASTQGSETFVPFASVENQVLGDTGISVPGGKRGDFVNGAFTSNHDVMRAINQVNGSFVSLTNTSPLNNVTGGTVQVGRAKVHAAVTMLTPGVSWIYYGDEIGMSSNTNTHVSKYGNENNMDIWYRQPFLWKDANKRSNYKTGQYQIELDSYNKTVQSAEDQQDNANSMFSFYKKLIEVKRDYPKNAKCSFHSYSSQNVLIMDIYGEGNDYRIFINTGISSDNYIITSELLNGYSFYKNIDANSDADINRSYSVLVYSK